MAAKVNTTIVEDWLESYPHSRQTFRHTYATLLHAFGTTPAVQKELLRHADIQTTLNLYTQATSADKLEVASRWSEYYGRINR